MEQVRQLVSKSSQQIPVRARKAHQLSQQSFAELWYRHGRADADADWRARASGTPLPKRGVM